MCRNQLDRARGTTPLVCVSRDAPVQFGDANLVVHAPRSPLTMHKQIVAGLSYIDTDIVFLCESDVLYHPSHFAVDAVTAETFVYNVNVWRVRYPDGLAVWTDDLQQVSGVCAEREVLLDFYTQRVAQLEAGVFNRHYEPGIKQSVGSRLVANRQSAAPNLCIRHDQNLTQSKWRPEDFRNPKYAQGWKETYVLPDWGDLRELFVKEVA